MIGHRKNKWTAEEEEALIAGIAKDGSGKWSNILDDPEFAIQLLDRTNVNLKDKWRNLRNRVEKPKTQKLKSASNSISPVVVSDDPSPNMSSDMNNESTRYNAMVLEAISTINDANGSDLPEILRFIEVKKEAICALESLFSWFKERHDIPQDFKKLLSYGLRNLVSQDKLKKVRNRYKTYVMKETKTSFTLDSKDSINPPELPSTSAISTISEETQVLIDAAANKVAEQIYELAEEHDVWYMARGQDFTKFLSDCLEILVSQGKLDKDLNSYEITELENKVLEAAPEDVAMKLAESHNKGIIAAEAIQDEQRMHKLVEESHTMLQFSLEIHKQCALGEDVILQ